MKIINPKYAGFFFLALMLMVSCQPKEIKNKTDNKETVVNPTKENPSEHENIDIRDKFILYNLDFQQDNQELHYFAIKTYCKSWDLPLIQMKSCKSDTYPIIQINDTLAIFKSSWIPNDWKYGIILLKPRALPLFIDFTNESQMNQISLADEYFEFNALEVKPTEHKMTIQDYENQYKNLLIDVDNYYDFQKKLEVMDSHFIDYSQTTNMTNEQFIKSFFSLKYHLNEKNYALIAHCLIQYPLEFIYDGETELIKSPEALLNRWDTIFSIPVNQSLGNSVYWRLSTEENAIYIDKGVLWFKQSGTRVKVTKIATP